MPLTPAVFAAGGAVADDYIERIRAYLNPGPPTTRLGKLGALYGRAYPVISGATALYVIASISADKSLSDEEKKRRAIAYYVDLLTSFGTGSSVPIAPSNLHSLADRLFNLRHERGPSVVVQQSPGAKYLDPPGPVRSLKPARVVG